MGQVFREPQWCKGAHCLSINSAAMNFTKTLLTLINKPTVGGQVATVLLPRILFKNIS